MKNLKVAFNSQIGTENYKILENIKIAIYSVKNVMIELINISIHLILIILLFHLP